MASSESALNIVRSSTRALYRNAPLRTLRAARYSHLTRTTHPALPALTIPHRIPALSPANTRSQSSRTDIPEKEQSQQPGLNTQLATTLQQSDSSDLVAEVHIPADPNGVLPPDHPALSILGNSSLVVARQLEMLNVLLHFEQANKYTIMDGKGQTVGFIAERDHGIGRSVARQLARTHRSFTTYIFDKNGKEVLRIHRPFAYLNTKIRIYDPIPEGGYDDSTTLSGSQTLVQDAQISPLKLEEMRIIGECQSEWTATRRRYNLFTLRSHNDFNEAMGQEKIIEGQMAQFSRIDEPMLSWDFTMKQDDGKVIGNVNRSFQGFAREIFTDTGVYALRMDAATQNSVATDAQEKAIARYEPSALTLDQRAVLIATAVSIDFDYFSSSSSQMGMMPMFIPFGGATAEGGAVGGAVGAAAGEAGIAGAAGAAGAAGRGIAGAGAVEGGMVGAGTMAGYEAMQQGAYGSQSVQDDASPQSPETTPNAADSVEQAENTPGRDDLWGAEQDPWSEGAGNAASEGGGSWLDTITSWFE